MTALWGGPLSSMGRLSLEWYQWWRPSSLYFPCNSVLVTSTIRWRLALLLKKSAESFGLWGSWREAKAWGTWQMFSRTPTRCNSFVCGYGSHSGRAIRGGWEGLCQGGLKRGHIGGTEFAVVIWSSCLLPSGKHQLSLTTTASLLHMKSCSGQFSQRHYYSHTGFRVGVQ